MAEAPSHRQRAGHYGLIGMRERAERLGGTISIVADRPKGTRVTISLPSGSMYA
jgi:signal transduction histidine kinase